MGLMEESIKEIQSVWMEAIHDGRELTNEEIKHILDIQKKVIQEQQANDGLTEEEALAENCSNQGIDIFGDKNC